MAKSIIIHKKANNLSTKTLAEKIQKTIVRLSEVDEKFNTWFLTDKKKQYTPIKYLELECIEKIVESSYVTNKDSNEVYYNLGMVLILKTNISFKKSILLDINFGSSETHTDSLLIHSPLFLSEMDLTEMQIAQIILLLKNIWNPDLVEVN